MRSIRPIVFHPLAFAAFPALFLYTHNFGQVALRDFAIAAAALLSAAALLVLVLSRLLHSSQKAAIITTLFWVLFFAYGPLAQFARPFGLRHRHLLAVCLLVVAAAVVYVVRRKKGLDATTRFLNLVGLFLIGSSVVGGAYTAATTRTKTPLVGQPTSAAPAEAARAAQQPARRPDVYYIILDGYGSSRTLSTRYGFDNGDFIASLQRRGFHVLHSSRSNYNKSYLSLASSLNMRYIHDLSDNYRLFMQMIRDNSVARQMKQSGYDVVHFSSGYAPTEHSRHASVTISCGSMNEFWTTFWSPTPVWLLMQDPLRKDQRERILCTFAKLAGTKTIAGPKFVFAHIVSPHPPFVFGPTGEQVKSSGTGIGDEHAWHRHDLYVGQLRFVNQLVTRLLDSLLSGDGPHPIIILQSDHGPAYPGKNKTDVWVRERMEILNAIYVPPDVRINVERLVTPVNTFRAIFNDLFQTKYPMLPDQSYYSNYVPPYHFVNVDAVVDGSSNAPLPAANR